MKSNWPRQPLIITPVIPLLWISSWLAITQACFAFTKVSLTVSDEFIESVLMVSAVVLLANVYNLILICAQHQLLKEDHFYQGMIILWALVLMVTTVLAWGKPSAVLTPRKLTLGPLAFLLLSVCQALLGTYFVRITRPKQAPNKLSLFTGIVTMFVTGGLVPIWLVDGGLAWTIMAVLLLVILVGWHFQQLPRILAPVLATKSGCYQMVVGIDLAAILISLFLGFDTVIMKILGSHSELIAVAFAIAMVTVGLCDEIIAGMQRYNNDYRYGHAVNHERAYLVSGIIIWLLLLIAGLWGLTVYAA